MLLGVFVGCEMMNFILTAFAGPITMQALFAPASLIAFQLVNSSPFPVTPLTGRMGFNRIPCNLAGTWPVGFL